MATGLTDADRDRIADYLAKPPAKRTAEDLVPHDGAQGEEP